AHRRFLGASSEEEVVGQTVGHFFSPELATQFSYDDQAIIHIGKPLLNREEPIVDRSGQPHWHSSTKIPLRNSAGKVVGLVGVSRDVTERKKAEEKLQQANSELGQSKMELEKVLADLQKSHEELKA